MNKQLVVLTFAAFGAFMLNASAAGVADLHAAKGQDCAACHMEGKPSSSNVSEASCQKCHGEEPAGKALERSPTFTKPISIRSNAFSVTKATLSP